MQEAGWGEGQKGMERGMDGNGDGMRWDGDWVWDGDWYWNWDWSVDGMEMGWQWRWDGNKVGNGDRNRDEHGVDTGGAEEWELSSVGTQPAIP